MITNSLTWDYLLIFFIINLLGIAFGKKALLSLFQTESWRISPNEVEISWKLFVTYKRLKFRKDQILGIARWKFDPKLYAFMRPRNRIKLATHLGGLSLGSGFPPALCEEIVQQLHNIMGISSTTF